MPLVTTASLVDDARCERTGVAAFNVDHTRARRGHRDRRARAGRPVILQVSENTVKFHGGRLRPLAAALAALASEAAIPVSLHLDHVQTADLWLAAAARATPPSWSTPARCRSSRTSPITAEAARGLHEQGLAVEAELGYVGGKEHPGVSAHAPGVRTDPRQAAEFVGATGVDALAVAVGSSHAMTSRTAELDLDLIGALRDAVPVPLVLHGSSGVPDDTLRAAVRAGIVKVNIGTALNVAYSAALRDTLTGGVDPRAPLSAARDAVADAVSHLIEVLGAG